MKYLNCVLTILVLLILAVFVRLGQMSISLNAQLESEKALITSQQSLINSQQFLSGEITDLRKQISELSAKVPQK